MANEIIKETAKSRRVKLWEIAETLGINDGNFSRLLRRNLSPEQTSRILSIIDELSSHAQKPKTNADRIRNMDDYDLAIFLENVSCKHADTASWLGWLKEEGE